MRNERDKRPPLLAVDGPLNPYAAEPRKRSASYSTHRTRPTGWENPWDKTLRVRLNHGHGADLLALPYEPVWATTWKHEVNNWIGPHLGLPTLPFVNWPSMAPQSNALLHGKTRALVADAEGRPFAWVDDELGSDDHEWVQKDYDVPTPLYWVTPRLGLLAEDFSALPKWVARLEQAAA